MLAHYNKYFKKSLFFIIYLNDHGFPMLFNTETLIKNVKMLGKGPQYITVWTLAMGFYLSLELNPAIQKLQGVATLFETYLHGYSMKPPYAPILPQSFQFIQSSSNQRMLKKTLDTVLILGGKISHSLFSYSHV
jgi:hypothetical protein